MARVILLILLGLTSYQTIAETSRVGNGGDDVLIEMKKIAQEVIDICRCAHPARSCNVINQSYFARNLNYVVFDTTDQEFYYHADTVTAINVPSLSRILTQRQRWMATTYPNKLALMFHELLGLAGAHEELYEESPQFLNYVVNVYTKMTPAERARIQCATYSKIVITKKVKRCEKAKCAAEALFVGGLTFHLNEGSRFILLMPQEQYYRFSASMLHEIQLVHVGADHRGRDIFEAIFQEKPVIIW